MQAHFHSPHSSRRLRRFSVAFFAFDRDALPKQVILLAGYTLDARGLLPRQRRVASERVVLVGERPVAQAVKSFERTDPITLSFISPGSRSDPGNLIGRLKKRFLKRAAVKSGHL